MYGSENLPLEVVEELAMLRARVAELESGGTARTHSEKALAERMRLATLTRDVSVALIQSHTLSSILHSCAEALVHHLDAAFARIWTLDNGTQVLELQASAGMYTHLDGAHSRVPVGKLKIGRIAQERLPHLTNAVIGDPRVSEQAWARREGMVAFAGYPLLVEGKLVGVMALFARQTLTSSVLEAMASVANAIALGIDHKWADEERRQLLEFEREARAEAEAALQVRNAFLSSVSHDLKTPLASIKGNAQLLQRRLQRAQLPGTIRFQETLAMIDAATTKMTTMIDELLDLAQLQTRQQLELDAHPVDLVKLARQVVMTVQQSMAKRHTIRVEAAIPELVALCDAPRMERVLANLLSNAIKYSPWGGEINVAVAQEQDWAVLAVRDQGVGIPAADLPHIFEPFQRASNVTGKIQGTGIGLASALQIIQQHGGSITATSEEKLGTTFTFRLPLLSINLNKTTSAPPAQAEPMSNKDTLSLLRQSVKETD
ncbi:MAG: hypothetical protein NVSMB27_14890 [Ktedonobacteraceae bacterium]